MKKNSNSQSNAQLKMFNKIKHSILLEINQLWKTDYVNFKIERTLMSYDIILNNELKIFGDYDYDSPIPTDFRICFKKIIYTKRKIDNEQVKNQIEFYLDDNDINLIEIENIEKTFNILAENDNILEHLYFNQLDFQNKKTDKTSFLELVIEYIEDKKKSSLIINR